MAKSPIGPEHEDFRKAIRRIGEEHLHSAEEIEALCRDLDLSPLEEDFLLRKFVFGEFGFGEDTQ